MDASVKTKKPGTQLERARKGVETGAAAIKSVGIIGAGQMGNGIAHVVALAGYDVAISDVREGRARQGALRHRAQHGASGLARHHHRGRDADGPEAHPRRDRTLPRSARPTS